MVKLICYYLRREITHRTADDVASQGTVGYKHRIGTPTTCLPNRVTRSVRKPDSERTALKWLILIGLLWAQFAYAGHQLAHDADDLGEPCQVCTGYGHFENALSDAVCAETVLATTTWAAPVRSVVPEVADRLRVYSARASPRSSDLSF